MATTHQIQAKWQQLFDTGIDLGEAVGLEQDAGFDSRYQQYEGGRIYHHNEIGTFAVRSPILDKYIEMGASRADPQTGVRELGFPTSDETRTEDGLYPAQYFEGGAIIWMRGVGGICIYGDIYQEWRRAGGEIGEWGYPVSDPIAVEGGQVVYFERGCMWQETATREIVHCRLYPPLLGRPQLIDPEEEVHFDNILIWEVPGDSLSRLESEHRDLFEQVWTNNLLLRPVVATGDQIAAVPLTPRRSANSREGFLHLDLVADPDSTKDRTLYNISLHLPRHQPYDLAPHSVYAKALWDNFGIIHATDLHLSRRVEDFRRKLRELGLENAVEQYNCFNDNFRDMVHYANYLYDSGKLDLILITGDVTDYIFEKDDNQQGGGNFYFFEQLVRGLWVSPTDEPGEELRVPVFTILGNHDYRPNGYDLLCDLDLGDEGRWDWWPDWLYTPAKSKNINGYAAHNLTLEESLALQGGHKEQLDSEAAYDMVRVDPKALRYYHERINDKLSYTFQLGRHRVVMIDSRWELGIVEGTFRDYLRLALNSFDEDARNWLAQHPNCMGFEDNELQMVKDTLEAIDRDALVIVGVHAPPINPSGDEWPHYFRETLHSAANEYETLGYLLRRDRKAFAHRRWRGPTVDPSQVYPDWIRTGTPYFKQGGIGDLLDYGIARGSTEDFLEMCVGQGVPRKVDLVLCGHIHTNVEYRLEWDAEKRFLFFTDFYTENPNTYYPTLSSLDPITGEYRSGGIPAAKVQIEVKEDAPPDAAPEIIGEGHARLVVPPYEEPLISTGNPRGWWDQHRPLIIQTASLGSMDRDQREEFPSPSFQGFRVISVENDVITNVHYVTLTALRRRDTPIPTTLLPDPPT